MTPVRQLICPFRGQNLEPGAAAAFAGLTDREAGDAEHFLDKEEAKARVLPVSSLEEPLLLFRRKIPIPSFSQVTTRP